MFVTMLCYVTDLKLFAVVQHCSFLRSFNLMLIQKLKSSKNIVIYKTAY